MYTTQHHTVCVDALRPGDEATVVAVGGDPHLQARLKALGVKPGLALRVVRRAPWGCPIEVSVRHVHLALRKEDAHVIQVACAA